MDLLDELTISDVSATTQDTFIKECEDGNTDIDDYPGKRELKNFST